MGVLNHHAPIKIGQLRRDHAPFLHNEFSKIMNVKAMPRRRCYYKNRTASNWETNRKQRNLVPKLRVMSVNNYSKKKI